MRASVAALSDEELADLDALDTLPSRQFAAGYAEVVKYGLIDDKFFFFWLEANRKAGRDADAVINLVQQAKEERLLLRVWSRSGDQSGSRYLTVDNAPRKK